MTCGKSGSATLPVQWHLQIDNEHHVKPALALPASAGLSHVLLQDTHRTDFQLIDAEVLGRKALYSATEQVDKAQALELLGEVAEAYFLLTTAQER